MRAASSPVPFLPLLLLALLAGACVPLAPYTRVGQVDLVRGVLDRLGVERVHLVGHSYGGALAMAFAEKYPERVVSLALVDPAHPDYPQMRRTRLAAVRPLTELYIRVWALRRGLVRRALESSFADDAQVTPEAPGS